MQKVIENIGVLDLRSTKEESIKEIVKIENVGTLIYSSQTAKLLPKLNIENMGDSIEVPEECELHLHTGQLEWNHEFFVHLHKPISLLLVGQLFIKKDVTPEDIENGIEKLYLTGQILCPEKCMSALQAKLQHSTGQLLPYPEDAKLIIGKISIDEDFLRSLAPSTPLAVVGKLDLIDEVDESLIDEKIDSLHVVGKITVREEYREILERKIKDRTSLKLKTIPAGYVYFNQLKLDSVSMKKFENAKIYASGMIEFNRDVSSDILRKCISALKTDTAVICKRDIYEAVVNLCEPSTTVLSYSDNLKVIEGEHELTSTELQYTAGKITYVVKGEVKISPEVEPKTLIEKIEYIDNFGEIIAGDEQYGVIQTKLRTNKGNVVRQEKVEKAVEKVSNVGYFKL